MAIEAPAVSQMRDESSAAWVENASQPAFHSQPGEMDEPAWEAIEISERYGSLKERTAILLLAEAFFRASRNALLMLSG
jgi:hypothetical protein